MQELGLPSLGSKSKVALLNQPSNTFSSRLHPYICAEYLRLQVAQQLDRVAALADEVAGVRTAVATAEAQGRRGRGDLARLREQKVPLWAHTRDGPYHVLRRACVTQSHKRTAPAMTARQLVDMALCVFLIIPQQTAVKMCPCGLTWPAELLLMTPPFRASACMSPPARDGAARPSSSGGDGAGRSGGAAAGDGVAHHGAQLLGAGAGSAVQHRPRRSVAEEVTLSRSIKQCLLTLTCAPTARGSETDHRFLETYETR